MRAFKLVRTKDLTSPHARWGNELSYTPGSVVEAEAIVPTISTPYGINAYATLELAERQAPSHRKHSTVPLTIIELEYEAEDVIKAGGTGNLRLSRCKVVGEVATQDARDPR